MTWNPIGQAQALAAVLGLAGRFQPAKANGDEADGGLKRVGNFHKGLKHECLGQVDLGQYAAYLSALNVAQAGGPFTALDAALPAAAVSAERLTNPMGGLAQDPLGVDPRLMPFAPAPSVTSEQCAVEMKELYWMALLRDLHFADYSASALVERAIHDLNAADGASRFLGGKALTPDLLFRGNDIPGTGVGPYISQFLYHPVRHGSLAYAQQQETVAAGLDYLMDEQSLLAAENGSTATRVGRSSLDPTRRYLRNGRDLARYAHIDAPYQAYYNAALILQELGSAEDRANVYTKALRMKGFATLGFAHLVTLLAEASSRALHAAWFQKWFVHRRLRPETYAALVHVGHSSLHGAISFSGVLPEIQARTPGSRLLPMAYPEGSPTHPAYAAGHASIAGACVTLLKAWFEEETPLLRPLVASRDGLQLETYIGPGATQLTVGGELNKLAANVALARNFAGVHWFSDYAESLRLGERVAAVLLIKHSRQYPEKLALTFESFDGLRISIANGSADVAEDPRLQEFLRLHGSLAIASGQYYRYI